MRLTQCKYTVEGLGFQKPKTVAFRDVLENEDVTFSEQVVPQRVGKRSIVITFTSKELQGMGGSTSVNVL